jgi:phage terminase Nu1 subunit (DNA packaging protein)
MTTKITKPPVTEKKKVFVEPELVGLGALARILGMTERMITYLVKDGVITKTGHGQFPLAQSVQAFVIYREKLATERNSKSDDPVEVERVRRMRRENDEAERLLIPLEEAIDTLSAIVGPIQSELATIPVHSTDNIELRERIEVQVTKVVNAISKRFEKLGRTLREGGDPFEAYSEGDTDGLGDAGARLSTDFGSSGTA